MLQVHHLKLLKGFSPDILFIMNNGKPFCNSFPEINSANAVFRFHVSELTV